MSERDTPSVRERQLARELRTLRATANLNGKEVAERLGWSPSKVSRIENGRIGISPEDLDRLIELYDAPTERATYLRRLAPSAQARGWWDAYAETLSSGYSSLLKLEAGSSSLQCYCALIPHALLLTPAFARSIIMNAPNRPSVSEVERRVDIVRRRQEILTRSTRPPLQLTAVIDEAVLHRRVMTREEARSDVVDEQLHWLVECARRPNITLQVLPFAAGQPPVSAGSFSILESYASGAPDVVYLENKSRTFFIDAEPEVHAYTQDFELLSRIALSPKESIRRIMKSFADA